MASSSKAQLIAWGLLGALAGCTSHITKGTGGGHLGADCGTCPSGYTCGSANGTPACFSPAGIPQFSNVVVIMMENTTLATLQAAGNTPYLTALGQSHASSSNYHGVTHPSLRNYIALTSGDPQGIGDDGILHKIFCDCHPTGSSCNALNCVVAGIPLGNCGCPINARNVADDLEAAGLTWRDYGESMGSPCNLTDSGNYAARHNPFLYYDDIQTTSRCTANVVDFGSFADDLQAGLPSFSLIAPNLVDDMHNPFPASSQNYANGDAWLSAQVPMILAASPFQPGGAGLLVIVWDEDDLSGGLLQSTDDPIPMFLMSPLAQSGGYVSGTQYDHYSLLATIEDGLGLPRLLNAQGAQPMADFFVNAGPPNGTTGGTGTGGTSGSAAGCASAADCPSDEACDLSTTPGICNGQCTSGNCACATDQQCDQATVVCTNGQCVAGCHVAGDCPSTQACDTTNDPGTCEQPCAAGNCVCSADSQCNGGQQYQGLICGPAGTCQSGCNSANDCPSTQACDTSANTPGACDTCLGAACACVGDSQCNGGQSGQGVICGPGGTCIAGCNAPSDCASGNCDLTSAPGTCD